MLNNMVFLDIDQRGVGTIVINHPKVYNAYNGELLEALARAVDTAVNDKNVRVIKIQGEGKNFQAGADINCLKSIASLSFEENRSFSALSTYTMKKLNECEKPLVVLVNGGCFGAGMGIVAAADIAIAEENAEFAISDARWGLVAGPILPQLVAAIGPQNTRRYALTAESFSVKRALEIGLIHHICPVGALKKAVLPILDLLLKAGPNALKETKRLIFDVTGISINEETADWIIHQNATQRQSSEASEGFASFLRRREPR